MLSKLKKKKLLVINGPNLNLLGTREPDVYGRETLEDVNNKIFKYGEERETIVFFYQSNHEGCIIDKIHSMLKQNFIGLIINPGALTHYSYAIRDAIKGVGIDTVEVHISDISKREKFRAESVIKDVCVKQIAGHGINGYMEAVDYLISLCKK